MRLSDHQAAFLLDVCKLVEFATNAGFKVTGGELQRPIEMQRLYVMTGRSTTMNSKHLKKCAIDLNFFEQDKYVTNRDNLAYLGEYWESLNPLNTWGGNWNNFVDTGHFQRDV
jgi:hypothetical protein